MFSRLAKKKGDSSQTKSSAIVTADELVFPDSATLVYFQELIAGFIHKHNNCLTVTQGFAQLLAVDNHDASVTESAEIIQTSAQKAIDLNSRIIACAATDAPKLSQFDSSIYLNDRATKEKKEALAKGSNFECELSAPSGTIEADPTWLNIILDEILQNAYDAIEENPSGKIVLASSSNSPLPSDPKLFRFLEVRDNGSGVPSEKLPQVFRPFFSTKGRDNAGIGLTRAGVLAGQMGVQIGITSSSDGSVVHVAIPLA